MAEKKARGRSPKYSNKEEIEEKITTYFKECEGEILRNSNGDPVLNRRGEPVIINQRPPTVTGLALALGFTNRMSLLRYQGKKEFCDTITRAKAMVEEYAEQRLFDRDGSNGAQFSLRNNFAGWNDRIQSALDEEEQRAHIDHLKAQTELIKAKAQTGETAEIADDGFLEALKGAAADDWSDGDDGEES